MSHWLHYVRRVVVVGVILSQLASGAFGAVRAQEVRGGTSVRFVVPGGAGAQTGLDWNNAQNLQPALQAAQAGDQLWVKAGTYKPTIGTDRAASFRLKNNVAVYGGFAGNETLLGQRNPALQRTILSGDLLGNDSSAVDLYDPSRADNSYHVVISENADQTAILDGVVLMAGNANDDSASHVDECVDGCGGGLLVVNGSPALSRLAFLANTAVWGAGMFVMETNQTLLLSQSIFSGNQAEAGSSVWVNSGQMTISLSTFSNNRFSLFSRGTLTVSNSIVWNYDTRGEYNERMDVQAISHSIVPRNYSADSEQNSDYDPGFRDADGADNIIGTLDDDLHVIRFSAADNGGSNATIPADRTDTDGDGNFSEPLPVDFAGNPRVFDATVGIGAYESQISNPHPPVPTTIFAIAGGAGASTGLNWDDAFDLQTALMYARSGDQIWLRQGVYTPTNDLDRFKSFQIKPNVSLYGGFAGNETEREQRNSQQHVTILSGDLRHNDAGTLAYTNTTRLDNSLHVLIGRLKLTPETLIDGVTVSDGNAYLDDYLDLSVYYGGGALLWSGPHFFNVDWTHNTAIRGGGVAANGATAQFSQTTFHENAAVYGGAIDVYDVNSTAAITVSRVTFSHNRADIGGAINSHAFSLSLINTRFIQNTASDHGGAISSYASGLTLVNNFFAGNVAPSGGAMSGDEDDLQIINSVFSENEGNPSAIDAREGFGGNQLTIDHSTFYQSKALGRSIVSGTGGSIDNSIIWGASTAPIQNPSGMQLRNNIIRGTTVPSNDNINPQFIDPNGSDNQSGTADDNLRLRPTSPAINTGNNVLIALDVADLDHDGNVDELLPFDADGQQRVANTVVDRGAYEWAALFVSPPPPATTYGMPYTHTFLATGVATPTYTLVAGTLPPGLALDANTGILSGTVTQSGVFTATLAASPTITQTVVITVTPAVLTVRPLNQSRAVGQPNPPLAAEVSGFVLDDTLADVQGAAACTTTATATSPPGSYPIMCTVGTLTAANYVFRVVGTGTLTITGMRVFLPLIANTP